MIFRFIADYIDKKGRSYHQPIIICDINNDKDVAIKRVKKILKKDKYKLIAITEVLDSTADIYKLSRIALCPLNTKVKIYKL